MTKQELVTKTDAVIAETRSALETVYQALNPGQRKQIIKDEGVRALFDRFGVMTDA